MKTHLLIIFLLTIIPSIIYCQEEEPNDIKFHFIEAGIGASHVQYTHGAFNVAFSNSLNKFMANFLDYNMAFDKSGVLFHEFNFKLGPYYQFSKYSYIAASSGLSFMWNTPFVEYKHSPSFPFPTPVYSEGEHLISIPIQVKLNIGVYKNCCIGIKGTYNKMMDNWVKDKGTAVMYLAWGW